MKRIFSVLSVLLSMIMLFPMPVSARQTSEVIYLEDDSYYVITIDENQSRSGQTKSGRKSISYYGSDGTLEWTAYLYGSFTYDGTTSNCTTSSCSVSISNSAWYVVSKNATKSGASASCVITMGRKVLGITVSRENVNLSLTCDAHGNLS